jgi:hypothetical protein
VILIPVSVISCEKNQDQNPDPSEGVKKFLEMKTRITAMNFSTGQMNDFLSVIGNSQLKDGTLSLEGIGVDSAYIDSVYADTVNFWDYYTCAVVTETDNPDGSHTTSYDYGTGCEEYGSLMKGKITYIWRSQGNEYSSKVIYDHYYSFGLEMNGMSEYTFISDGNSYYTTGVREEGGSDSAVSTGLEFNWSGSSTADENITMVYDSGETYSYSSSYANKWDSISFTVVQGEYEYSGSLNGVEYHYLVTKPLVTDYSCSNTWVPVSGIETATYTESGSTSSFSINYGNGRCDNLAVVTENGIVSVIDFGEIYQILYDGTITPGSSPANTGKGKK